MYRLRRRLRTEWGRLFHGIRPERLADHLRALGVERGATLCVHSSLSQLGYVAGGAEAVIDTLMALVGEEGCLAMPSFPTADAMQRYLAGAPTFDVRATPSRVGAITEAFRRRAGVARSLHPTHAVAAWGRGAAALLEGHERSPTPYGRETPYGRLAEAEDAFLLMLGTRLLSLPHHLQERVDFPNLFLPGEATARVIDWEGRERTLRTRVMRPKVPYFVAIPPAGGGAAPDWCVLHDFCLIFPRARACEVRRLGYSLAGYPRLWRRRDALERCGILRTRKLGRGEIGLLRVKPFVALIEPELAEMIARYRPAYDPERIAAMDLPR